MKALALWAIRLYQRLISPHKGFRCAYRGYTGHAGCSALGYRAIRRFGVIGGVKVLRSRLNKCGVAYRRYRPAPTFMPAGQGGFLDCDCGGGPDSCDANPCDCNPCDIDWGNNKKRKKQRDRYVPPRRNRGD